MIRFLSVLSIVLGLTGCSGSGTDKKPTAPEKQQEDSMAKQAVDRMTGKTAVDTLKNTKDVLGDVEKVRDKRANELEDFKRD